MAHYDSSFFEPEKAILEEAKELIKTKNFNNDILVERFSVVLDLFDKTLRDMEKIIKISDGQQEYLHRIQNELKKEIEDRIRAEERLKYVAAIDALTGCYNRGMGLTYLENEIIVAKRNKSFFSICYIDVNKLKYVNDFFGHFEGDEFLVLVCKFIKQKMADRDILCRLGGDEFLVIFPEVKIEEAEKTMENIISNINIGNKNKLKPYPISFSYGVVEINHDNTLSIDEIIQIADKKMYENKQEHR